MKGKTIALGLLLAGAMTMTLAVAPANPSGGVLVSDGKCW